MYKDHKLYKIKLLVKLIKPWRFEALKERLLRCEKLEEDATSIGLEERLASFLGGSTLLRKTTLHQKCHVLLYNLHVMPSFGYGEWGYNQEQ